MYGGRQFVCVCILLNEKKFKSHFELTSCFHVEATLNSHFGEIKRELKVLAINQGVSNLKLSPSVKPSFSQMTVLKQ